MVAAMPWVNRVNVTMSAQPAKPIYAADLPMGLQTVSNIIAVSSCKVIGRTVCFRYTSSNLLSFTTILFCVISRLIS